MRGDHEGGTLMNGIRALVWVMRDRTSCFCSPPWEDYRGRWQPATWKRACSRAWPCWDPALGLPASRAVRETCLLFINCLVYSSLLGQPELTKTTAEETESQQESTLTLSKWQKRILNPGSLSPDAKLLNSNHAASRWFSKGGTGLKTRSQLSA